jgi:two-component system sensor histidine kinase CiaH
LIQSTKIRVFEGLAFINLVILFLSALSGYFLAGRTLRPIKEMVDDQNRFITDASHELNTPLTALKTSIEVNLRNKNLRIEKAKELLLSNLEDVNSLQALSDELIKLSQYQKPNGNVLFEKIQLLEAVNQALDKIIPLSQKKKIKISTNVPKVVLMADEKSLIELFVILLDNAVKYSNDKTAISVKARKTDSKIEITIEDQGLGIAKEDIPFIFDRFFRAEKSRTKQQALGYGLGLSIAKRIVDMHSGTIDVESEVGIGTKFTILLNLA